jgi:hypothetical protein
MDLKLIEAQKDGPFGNLYRYVRYGVGLGFALFDPLALYVDPSVYVQHECMEVDTAFVLDWRAIKKQVHQRGLASTNGTVNVDPMPYVNLLFEAEAFRPAFAFGRCVVDQAIVQNLQHFSR